MKKVIFTLILLFVFILNSYAVNTIVTGKIEYGTDKYKETISLDLNCTEDFSIKFPSEATDIMYINGTLINKKEIYLVGCKKIEDITYSLPSLENYKNELRIERKFSSLSDTNFTYKLNLPIEYLIDKNESIPLNYNVEYSDMSKEITFTNSEIYLIYIIREQEEEHKSVFLSITDEISEGYVVLLLILSFVLGIFGGYNLFKRNSKKESNIPVPSFVLSQEERKVLDVIKKNKGINQKQIGKELDFSKARVSHIVNDLEQKKLIKRERFGRSFKVYLDKKIL